MTKVVHCQLIYFITALEILAIKIRNDTSIKEIKIDNKELKISLLADDITMLLNDLNSVKSSLVVLKISNVPPMLRCQNNVEKTQAKYISSLENDDYFPYGLLWIKTPKEALSITIINNVEQNYKYNFQN